MIAPRLYTCTRCHGTGEDDHGRDCRRCEGHGTTPQRPRGDAAEARERKAVSERAVSELNGPRSL